MDFFDGIKSIQNRIKELIVKLDNNEGDLDELETEFIQLQNLLNTLEKKIGKAMLDRDKKEIDLE